MIYVIKNKDHLFVCSNERKQAIFDFNGTLGLSEIIRDEEIKKLKNKSSFSKIENEAVKRNIRIQLCDLNRINNINHAPEISVTNAENSLEFLARHADEFTQFGFMTKQGTKVLYGRDLGLKHVPDYFKGFLGAKEARLQLSYKVHDLLTDYLQNFDYKNAGKLIDSYLSLDFDSFLSKLAFSFFSLKKKKRIDSDKKDLGRVLVCCGKDKSSSGIFEDAVYSIKKLLSLPVYSYKHVPFLDVRCPKKDEKKVERELKQNYEAFIAKTVCIPSVENVVVGSRYSNLVQIGAYSAHEKTKGRGIRIGVIDTGVDYSHEQLKSRFGSLKGYDFVNETLLPQDDNGHGSHVAGTIAGLEVGVAPESSLFALKVLDSRGYGSEADVISAIDWAIDNELQVINLSLGSSRPSNAEAAAIRAALSNGVAVIAAAGNDGNSSYNFPASYPGVFSVAAVNHRNEHAYFSNHNNRVFISAPGVDIFSCYRGNSYRELSGTSMATPHITGAAALILSIAADAHLEEILRATAQKLGKGNDAHLYFGAGIARADRAVASILQYVEEK
jgi:hypothetical protein